MTTAVVTITRDRDAHLHRQRRGLAAAPPDLHVIVGMGAAPRLDDVPGAPATSTLLLPVHRGGLPLAAARNLGAAAALGAGADLLVFLDVDCIPDPRLLPRYAAAAAATPEPALLCGPVAHLPPPPPGGYPDGGLAALAPPHPARPAPPDGEIVADDRFALFWSLSFAVTARTWSALGGFCEEYRGYGGEDTDFAETAAARGAGLYWVGGADAYHQHHAAARTDPARIAEIVRNARLFRHRWGWWPMEGWLTELAAAGAVTFDPAAGVLALRTAPPPALRTPTRGLPGR
ncbi:MAG: glycosyltransferase family 2 protein [Pseudonocardia sp.]|nr:glycosyltransferase family 2 protein [Pseudonocardia sp.]